MPVFTEVAEGRQESLCPMHSRENAFNDLHLATRSKMCDYRWEGLENRVKWVQHEWRFRESQWMTKASRGVMRASPSVQQSITWSGRRPF